MIDLVLRNRLVPGRETVSTYHHCSPTTIVIVFFPLLVCVKEEEEGVDC